ncbi:Os05g0248400 [Oryza sativa Japonica Group]|uniref:Os05g0248400 protein n=1 Tax=Oryza sativa subsp. japonica TaxID=39947 RepID=A0A0P0WJV9_ORYSJ|nr:Os05g0248400 [Oryza sativa Japonica Group]
MIVKEMKENIMTNSSFDFQKPPVLYLDNVDFGSRNVDQSCPRISVWKDDMISTFSELDKIDENTFGLRPLKDFQDTCYFKRDSTQSRSVIIQDKLDSAIGSMLPDFLKHEISEMLSSHCFSHHLVDSESCEDLVVSILSLIAKASGSDAVQDQNESDILHSQVNTEAGPSSLRSAPNIRSLRNDEPFDKSALKSIEKDCPSLDRIAALYGSSVNCDDGNNNESIHINDITGNGMNCDISDPSNKSNVLLSSMNRGDVVINGSGNGIAPSFAASQPVATPDVGYLRNINNDMNQSNAGSSVAAFSLVKNVANKFRSRLTQLNSRAAIFGEDRPSFRLLDSDDDVSDCDKDNELGVNALMQHVLSYDAVDIDGVKEKEKLPSNMSSTSVMEKLEKSFVGAGKARKLHLCDMIANLQIAWDKFVCVPMDFQRFQIVFPPVPRQDFSCDSRIYVMKFTELWSPRIILSTVLSNENIKNIRVQYANQIFFHPKNRMLQTEIEDVVLNWFDQEKFPRTRQPTFTSAAQKKFCQ